jgi:hypothetical protein
VEIFYEDGIKIQKIIAYIVSYGYEIWSFILKEVHKLNELENREVRDKGDYLYQSNEVMRKHQDTEYKKNLRGFSPQANYTDRATAACRRSYCQL